MLKRTFFVTGLPRSRTAWLANFLTHGNSLCFHEVSRQIDGITKMREIFESAGSPIVGTADSGFLHYYETALKEFPNATIVIVERDTIDVTRSLARFLKGHVETTERAGSVVRNLHQKLTAMKVWLKDNPNVLRVPYETLDDPNMCLSIWHHCTGLEQAFNTPRWKVLRDLRVETLPARAIEQAQASEFTLDAWCKRLDSQYRDGSASRPRTPGPGVPTRGALQDEYNGLLLKLCANTPGAAAWVQSLWEILLTWDHIEDGDEIDKAMANRAFEALMLYWPQNPFFIANKDRLLPVMFNAISAWRHSNCGGPANKGWDFYTEIPCTMAAIIGGMTAINQYLPRLRDLAEQLRAADNQEDNHHVN